MDDIVVTGSYLDLIRQFIDLIGKQFDIKDLGYLSYFFGLTGYS